jgi:Fic family protein
MPWNWELPDWPKFRYDPDPIVPLEREFLLGVGSAFACLKTIDEKEYRRFIVEILSVEGVESSRIEGESLDRESLQSSIRMHFGLDAPKKQGTDKEARMAHLLCDVYDTFDQPLTHEMLWRWHSMLFKPDASRAQVDASSRITDDGKYRTHAEPMQIVSSRYDATKIFFEAPPSSRVFNEMTAFVDWFNSANAASVSGRAAVAHIYFESIHPFEDGNGRIGRVLAEKILSQGMGRPILIAISRTLEKRKKEYYASLELCNRTLDVQQWVEFFSSVVVQAQRESLDLLYFLIEKSKMFHSLSEQINPRQMKVLQRMFAEGPAGFKGGLSAENYISITKAGRATATRDLTDLVEKGALVKTGELRHTRYWLNLSTPREFYG